MERETCKIERMLKPKWNGVYALPTYALKNSLGAWMDGIIELTPLRMESNDEMWAISCEQEINTKLLFEHIIIWLHSYYLSNSKVSPIAKSEIQSLIHSMNVEELNALAGSKTVRLFDSNGIPTESYSYAAFSLMVTNALVGKSIMIDGHEVVLNYAGKINWFPICKGMVIMFTLMESPFPTNSSARKKIVAFV